MTQEPQDNAPAVAVLPYGPVDPARLPGRALDEMDWPLGRPARLARGTLADLSGADHLVAYARGGLLLGPAPALAARLSLLFAEPAALHAHLMLLARLRASRFHRILTCNPRLLGAIANGVTFPLGSTWIAGWEEVDCTKTRMLSLIASGKRMLRGHRLRHRMAAYLRDAGIEADVMGGGYQPFALKHEGLAPYRFSVVIENAREPGYFTEKLVDAFLCRTVPIYWGAPDIARYFDPAGMILCTSATELEEAVAGITAQDYEARRPAIEANRLRAAAYAPVHQRAARAVLGLEPEIRG